MGNQNFAEAVGLLKNNQVTATPIQTQYGWHVLQLLGTRDRPPPSFEGVQDQLKRILLSKKYRAYSDDLLKVAKVDPPLASTPAAAPSTAPASAAAPAATPEPAPPSK
jgi:peptidyl-prolyl cis-trans isomerase C